MVYNVHDVLKKVIGLKYNKIKEHKNLIFSDDFFLNYHFSRWNIEYLRNLHTSKNSYLFNND